MSQQSTSANRISTALRALRQVYADEAADKAALGLKCLQAVLAELAAEGVPADDLKPLADIEKLVGASKSAEPVGVTPTPVEAISGGPAGARAPLARERRRGAPPSTTLLARAAVMIDLLVKGGQQEAAAAQSVMRALILSGVPAPTQGGDSRGWRRLLEFRNTLLQGGGPEEARIEYRAFEREVEAIPSAERIARVTRERLWDRRINKG